MTKKAKSKTSTNKWSSSETKVPNKGKVPCSTATHKAPSKLEEGASRTAKQLLQPGGVNEAVTTMRDGLAAAINRYERGIVSLVSGVYRCIAVCRENADAYDDFCKDGFGEDGANPSQRNDIVKGITDCVTNSRDLRYKLRAAVEVLDFHEVPPDQAYGWIKKRGGGLAGLVDDAKGLRRCGVPVPVNGGAPTTQITLEQKLALLEAMIFYAIGNCVRMRNGQASMASDFLLRAFDQELSRLDIHLQPDAMHPITHTINEVRRVFGDSAQLS